MARSPIDEALDRIAGVVATMEAEAKRDSDRSSEIRAKKVRNEPLAYAEEQEHIVIVVREDAISSHARALRAILRKVGR